MRLGDTAEERSRKFDAMAEEAHREANEAPPKGEGPYGTRAEEAIDWYRHFMRMEPKVLLKEYLTRREMKDYDTSEAIEMAFQDRTDEMLEVLD